MTLTKMENSWTKPQTEVLISILERYPVLYKCTHKDFSKSYVKEKAYRDIVAQFIDVKSDVTISSLKRKIKTLRSQMWAEERNQRLARRKGSKDVYQPKLWCYKQLQFLLNPNEDYLDEDEDLQEEEEQETDVKSVKDYVDIDQTVLEPSPQRIRNILTLEERVAAIEAYDCRPMYTKVAKMFNCSWEQIKNIIANRDAIMEFYMATRNAETQNDSNRVEVRSRKISFLGECLYEYIQRAQFHTKAHITEDLLRMKAIEFREMIQIDNFMPNKTWINHFKATYNFSLSNRQITITRTPPISLDLKDIMTYCTKNKAKVPAANQIAPVENRESDLYRTTTRIAISGENEAALQEMKQRRLRKINFLKKTLFEYWQRASHHHKMRMNENSLRKVAFELKEMLKIDNFYPSKEWLNNYITVTYPSMLSQTDETRPPPLSLDLKDILSFCSRQENKKQAPSTITLAPKETTQQQVNRTTATTTTPPATTPLVQIHTFNLHRNDDVGAHERIPFPTAIVKTTASTTRMLPTKIKEEVIELDADEDEQDIKPNVHELVPPPKTPQTPERSETEIKITTKSINTKATTLLNERQQQTVDLSGEKCVQQMPALRVVSLSTLVPPPLAPLPTVTLPNVTMPATPQQALSIGATQVPDILETTINRRKRPRGEMSFPHQPLKIHKIESIGAQTVENPVPSPGHWSEHSDPEEEELPRHVKNYKDALKLLKPLEEFAMLEENYRVIGLISQLEDIFKHPPQKEDTE